MQGDIKKISLPNISIKLKFCYTFHETFTELTRKSIKPIDAQFEYTVSRGWIFTSCVARVSQIVQTARAFTIKCEDLCTHVRYVSVRLPREPIHFSTDFYLSTVRTRPVEQPRGLPLFAATLFISLDTAHGVSGRHKSRRTSTRNSLVSLRRRRLAAGEKIAFCPSGRW